MAGGHEIPSASDLILHCEERGAAPPYGGARVTFSSKGESVFILSDLHLGAGKGRDGASPGTENFFADDSFHRFLQYAQSCARSNHATLIINGDFVDFMRITGVPATAADFAAWRKLLLEIGVPHSLESLQSSITAKEKQYGLKTHDFKSVYKLMLAAGGHAELFDALADWVAGGHQLVVLKGNHDLEWYWPAVRNCLRWLLAGRDPARLPVLLGAVTFVDDSLVLDDEIYLEHGHRFDRYTNVLGAPVIGAGDELNIPFGSFFNRYLINLIELEYPFLDNVRPPVNLLPLLVRERLPLAIRVLAQHIPFLLRVIPKQYYRYMLRRVLVFLAIAIAGTGAIVWLFARAVPGALHQAAGIVSFLNAQQPTAVGGLVTGALSYLLARVAAWFQLEEPDSLTAPGRQILRDNPRFRVVTFGHTHNPDQIREDERWFFNTGTWIPIVEISNAQIREDRTYTFLELHPDRSGKLQPSVLLRWNDEAGRAEPLVIVRRKGSD